MGVEDRVVLFLLICLFVYYFFKYLVDTIEIDEPLSNPPNPFLKALAPESLKSGITYLDLTSGLGGGSPAPDWGPAHCSPPSALLLEEWPPLPFALDSCLLSIMGFHSSLAAPA